MSRNCIPKPLTVPRVERCDAHRRKIRDVSSHHFETVNQCSCGDQSVTLRSGVGNVQGSASLGNCRIYRQDPAVEGGKHVGVDPASQHCALHRIATQEPEGPGFHFKDRDRRKEKFGRVYPIGPRGDPAARQSPGRRFAAMP
jgi:hypothetical protein